MKTLMKKYKVKQSLVYFSFVINLLSVISLRLEVNSKVGVFKFQNNLKL